MWGGFMAYKDPGFIRITKEIKRLRRRLHEAEEEIRDITNKHRKRRQNNFINHLKGRIGWLLFDCGDFKKGIAIYLSMSWKTHGEEKYLGIGRGLMEMGYYFEAGRIMEKGLKRFPESSPLWTALGVLHYRIADHFNALKYFEAALKLDPKSRHTLYDKALSLNSLECYEEAAELLKYLIEKYPNDPEYLTEMGYSLTSQGYDEDAITFYKRAKDTGYPSPEIYSGLYCTYANLGLQEAALEMAEKGLREFPDVPYMYANLGQGYFERGWVEEARNILNEGLRKFPDDEDIQNLLEKIDDEIENPDKGKTPPIIGLLLLLSLLHKRFWKKK
jgi:tetratricopeptide (TPR) repeat protein